MNFTFERLSEDNLHLLGPLYYALYKKRLPPSYFTNKYNTKYLCDQMFGYFAFHNQTVAAFTGMIPYQFRYKGALELSVQSSDTMTHPGYRGHGLFKQLVERIYDDLNREKVAFIWGFANAGSFRVTTHYLNWQPTVSVNGYCIPVTNNYLAWLRRKWNAAYYGEGTLLKIFEKEIIKEYPANSLAGSDFVTTERGAGYYNYKKFGGNIPIQIEGVRIWMKMDGSIFIGDMDNISAEELKKLVPLLKVKAEQCGAGNIYFQSQPGSQIEAFFASLYPKFESWTIPYHNLNSAFPLDKIRVTMGDLDSF